MSEIIQQTKALSNSERFTAKIFKEFGENTAGEVRVTEYQRELINGYFITIDKTLKVAEEKRYTKENDLPIAWENINLTALAIDLVHYARLGLDMRQKNHLFPIPFKNKKTQKYDLNLMRGYNGIQYIAEKYAVVPPKNVTIEVVYSTDVFTPIKKSLTNPVESYEFKVTNPFDRGEIIGGFGYIQFEDATKNEIVMLSMQQILKRKPKHASGEFWGGQKKEWENGKQVMVETEGWLDEMVRKTLIREVYSEKHIPVDPQKVDDNYQYMKANELRLAEMEANLEIEASANTTTLGNNLEEGEVVIIDQTTGVVVNGADF